MRLRDRLKQLEEAVLGGGGGSAQTITIPSVVIAAGQDFTGSEEIAIEYGKIYRVSFSIGSFPKPDANTNLCGPMCPGASHELIGGSSTESGSFGSGDAVHLGPGDSNGVTLLASWLVLCTSDDVIQAYFANGGTVPLTAENVVITVKEV